MVVTAAVQMCVTNVTRKWVLLYPEPQREDLACDQLPSDPEELRSAATLPAPTTMWEINIQGVWCPAPFQVDERIAAGTTPETGYKKSLTRAETLDFRPIV